MTSGSVRRSRMTLITTASSIVGQNTISLDNIMAILTRNNVRGPYALEACHKGAVSLGAGAQFDVYGRRMPVASGIPRFDGPYLEEAVWQMENGDPETFKHTPRHVAIKRAYLSERRTRPSVFTVKSADERGVERSQLRNITHEILALVHPLLRQHPNIISILGWGYDQAENDKTVFSPVLIVEHARMSAEALASQSDLPLAIRMHICHGMLSGIKALHECAIVHCDIKPGNILIFARNDSPFLCIAKVSDFGFAEQEIRSRSINVSDLPRGTAGWAAPEQEARNFIPVELVHRRDVWSCGLTVWSILALHGQTPRLTNDKKARILEDFTEASVSDDVITDLLGPLLSSLLVDVSNRADSVEGIRSVLERTDWPDSVEVKHRFRQIFSETVDWMALAAQSLMFDGVLSTDAITPQNKRRRDREARISWKYSLERATAYNARDHRLLRHLIAEGCSITEMFNISLAHAQDDRYSEELEALYQTACKGYLPAQALYSSLADILPVRGDNVPFHSQSQLDDWIFRAASSGYLFGDIAGLERALILEARKVFRDNGGYSTHYCGTGDEDENSSGLVGSLEADLHDAPLHLAAAFDDLVTPHGVSSLLESSMDINSLDHWQDTALMKCCMAGHLASLRILITDGADASITNPSNGLSPLHWLFMFDDNEMAEAISLLISGGSNPNHRSVALAVKAFHFPFAWPSGTPLHWAVFARNELAVRALLDHGANIVEVDAAGQDSLRIAMKMLNVEIVQVLLGYSEPHSQNDPLHSFDIISEDQTYTIPTSAIDPDTEEHRSPLHDFTWEPLVLGVDPELEDWCSEEVALPRNHYMAVFSGPPRASRYIEILKLFQQRYQMCLHWRTDEGFTPLDMALAFADPEPEIVQYMVDNGSPIDARTIHWALMGHYRLYRTERDIKATYLEIILRTLPPETAKELVNWPLKERGERTNLVPLQYATIRGFLLSAQVLLKYGADPRAERENGRNPLDFAQDLVTGDVTKRMTKIPDTPAWPGISYELSRETYGKEQVRMQEDANTERREILLLFENHRPSEASSML